MSNLDEKYYQKGFADAKKGSYFDPPLESHGIPARASYLAGWNIARNSDPCACASKWERHVIENISNFPDIA